MTEEQKAPEKPKLTVRSALTLGGVVLGVATTVGLFVVAGPLIAAAVPAAAVGTAYTRHRIKNPRKGGLFEWLSGKARRPGLSRSGQRSISGRLLPVAGRTGSSSRRNSGSIRKGTSRSVGSLLPKTTRSRARSGAGGVLPKRPAGARQAKSPTAGRARGSAGTKRPSASRQPKTPYKTPARPATRTRPTGLRQGVSTSPKRSKGAKPSTPGRSSTTRRQNPLRGLASGSRRSTPKGAPSALLRKGSSRGSTSGRPLSRSRRSLRGTAGRLGRTISPFRTSPSGHHRRLKSPFRRTPSKPFTAPSKLVRKGVPQRSRRFPMGRRRTPALRLIRDALGLPTRNKAGKLVRPSAKRMAKARRTLHLRGLARLWAVRKLPGKALNWHWNRIFARVPSTLIPEWTPTAPQPEPPEPTPPTTPQPRVKGHLTLLPSPTGKVVPTMSAPNEVITEAFQQLAMFQPESASDMSRFLEFHHEMFASIGQAYNTLADRMTSEMPYGGSTADSMRDLGAAFTGLASVAQEVHGVFRSEHAPELARIEAPRPDERQWDTNQQ